MDSADTDSAEHWAHQEKLLGKHVHVQVQLRKVIKAMKNETAYFLQYHFCRVQTFSQEPHMPVPKRYVVFRLIFSLHILFISHILNITVFTTLNLSMLC